MGAAASGSSVSGNFASGNAASTGSPSDSSGRGGSAPAGSAENTEPTAAAIDRFGVTPEMQRQRQIQGKAPAPLREITAHVASVHYLPRGEIVVGLDNGQTWQQAEYDGDVALNVGEVITIKAGALSAFYLKPHRGRIVRVRRLH
jgi:hypothetical protein